mmetsp:Transcript_28437/g.43940  ORF Transcript_28437/g.43940 Transcript_28437/m.43940 type:complete len:210 (+) Transcript_28437:613-1242(+)
MRWILWINPSIIPLRISIHSLSLRFRYGNLPRRVPCPTSNWDSRSYKRFNPSIPPRCKFAQPIWNSWRRCIIPIIIIHHDRTTTTTIASHHHPTLSHIRPSRTSHDTIFHSLHPPKTTPNHTLDRINLEFILQHYQLQSNRISNRDIRKVNSINCLALFIPWHIRIIIITTITHSRTCTTRPTAPITTPQYIRTNNKIPISIKRLPRSK